MTFPIDSVIPGPGAKSVDHVSSVLTVDVGHLMDRRDWLVKMHTEHKMRVKTVTNVVTGNWYVEWPDLSQTPEAPTVANIIELGINHWGAVGGAVLPSIKVPINVAADRKKEKPAARKRQRRVSELWDSSNASELAALLWGDYAGAGVAVFGAWVNFEEEDSAKRNPYMIRFDPRHTYPLKDNLGNITELLVARGMTHAELKAMYPGYEGLFGKSREEDLEEQFWYTRDRMMHIIVDLSKKGRKADRYAILTNEEWDLPFIPVYESVRPTFDGQRRGVFDQTVHILRTMQRLQLMTIKSTEENAFPAIGVYDVVNPKAFGPGAIMQYRSRDSKVERLGPEQHFDVKDLIARLGEEARTEGIYPQQLTGEPGASIVSARGIVASMGALDARLALAHKQFEVLFGKVSGFLLALDETFCDGDKIISGDMNDTNKAEEYRPSKHIAGAWSVMATYGIGAGSDPANVEVRISMHLANRLISRETARHELPYLRDPDGEEVKIFRETMQDALAQGVLAAASQGDYEVAAKVLDKMGTDDIDFDELIGELVELLAPPEQPGGPGGLPNAGEQVQGAESLARGGVPGNAEQGLPALSQVLGGQGAGQVI